MENKKRIIVIGGGTFNHIANHLSLSAPAFGTTAKALVEKINSTDNMEAELVLTKMADSTSKIITNDDLSNYIDTILEDSSVMLLKENPEMDCIVHTHNPLTEWSKINIVEQYPFQCGSNECGLNTISGIKEYKEGNTIIKSVYLNKHGANIMFNSEDSAEDINRFIENNLQLGVKTT